jgi:hypothetical protein
MPQKPRADDFAEKRTNIEVEYERETERRREKTRILNELRQERLASGWRPSRKRKRKAQTQGESVNTVLTVPDEYHGDTPRGVSEPTSGGRQPEWWDPTPLAPPPDPQSDSRTGQPANELQRVCVAGCGRWRPWYEFKLDSPICRACMKARRERWAGYGVMEVRGITPFN